MKIKIRDENEKHEESGFFTIEKSMQSVKGKFVVFLERGLSIDTQKFFTFRIPFFRIFKSSKFPVSSKHETPYPLGPT